MTSSIHSAEPEPKPFCCTFDQAQIAFDRGEFKIDPDIYAELDEYLYMPKAKALISLQFPVHRTRIVATSTNHGNYYPIPFPFW